MAEERVRKSSPWTTLTAPLWFHNFSQSHVWWKGMMIWPEKDRFWFHSHFSSKQTYPLINSNTTTLVFVAATPYNHTGLLFNGCLYGSDVNPPVTLKKQATCTRTWTQRPSNASPTWVLSRGQPLAWKQPDKLNPPKQSPVGMEFCKKYSLMTTLPIKGRSR